MRRIIPYVANVVIITDLIFLFFVIFQKQMRWWAIVFREAHSALLTRPRFQSTKTEEEVQKTRYDGEKEAGRTDARRLFGVYQTVAI
jgi:hypothetical protein